MINFTQFFNKKFTSILSGAELLLAVELDKVAKERGYDGVSVESLTIRRAIREGSIFKYAMTCGLKMKASYASMPLQDCVPEDFNQYPSDKFEIVKSDREYVFRQYRVAGDEKDCALNRTVLCTAINRSYSYVTVIAVWLFDCYEKNIKPVLVIDARRIELYVNELMQCLVLRDYGNKLIERDRIVIEYDEDTAKIMQPDWEAYKEYYRQLGYMPIQIPDSENPTVEKYTYTSKHYEVGDVVLHYTLHKKWSSRTLQSCTPAVIREINEKGITIEDYGVLKTRLTRKHDIQEAESNLFTSADVYQDVRSTVVTFRWMDVGIDMYYFECMDDSLLTEVCADDGMDIWVTAGITEQKVWFPTQEAVYALMEDWGIKYNRDKYLSKYFKGKTPMWDKYKSLSSI